ncbi:MAG: hypothetical protein ACWA5T_12290 [Parvularcula sp.]
MNRTPATRKATARTALAHAGVADFFARRRLAGTFFTERLGEADFDRLVALEFARPRPADARFFGRRLLALPERRPPPRPAPDDFRVPFMKVILR